MRWLQLLFLSLVVSSCLPTGSSHRSFQTTRLKIDRVTPLDQALQTGDKFMPIENQPGELIWLTGAKTRCFDADGATLTDRFLGYSTLDFRWPEWHNLKFVGSQSTRLFGLGRGVPEYNLPEGYGIPMHSNEPLWYTSRIANPDPYLPAQKLGQDLQLNLTRERGLRKPYQAVLVRPVDIRQSGSHVWELPPGDSSVRSEITGQLYLTENCRRLVGMTAWMLDHGRSVVLLDLTTGDKLLELDSKLDADGLIQEIESYSDGAGVLLASDHRYALEATFEKAGQASGVGGAYVNLYFQDSEFVKPPR